MVKCPNCGTEFRARRAAGEGSTVDPSTPLSKNEASLLELLKQAFKIRPYGVTAKQVDEFIAALSPRPTRDSGKDWNPHYVQSDMSRLVGRGIVKSEKMSRGNALLYLPTSEDASK